jgi:hypothetical protein
MSVSRKLTAPDGGSATCLSFVRAISGSTQTHCVLHALLRFRHRPDTKSEGSAGAPPHTCRRGGIIAGCEGESRGSRVQAG